jgi:hypothetical protein
MENYLVQLKWELRQLMDKRDKTDSDRFMIHNLIENIGMIERERFISNRVQVDFVCEWGFIG